MKTKKGITHYPYIRIYNTNREVLEWVKSVVGCGWITTQPERKDKRGIIKTSKPLSMLGWGNKQSREIIKLLLPHLKIKRLRAEKVLSDFYAEYKESNGKAVRL